MENFKEIAEKVLNNEVNGVFVLRSGNKVKSNWLSRNEEGLMDIFPYYLAGNGTLTANGTCYEKIECELDVVDFIKSDK